MNDVCPICRSSLNSPIRASGDKYPIDCPRCGEFVVSGIVRVQLENNPLNSIQIACASGWLRENQVFYLNNKFSQFPES